MPIQETFLEFTFEAAHATPPYSNLHGHSFRVSVGLHGEPDPVFGWSHNLYDVEPLLDEIKGLVDHRYLNDVSGLEVPTLENVTRWMWVELNRRLEGVNRVTVRRGHDGAAEGCTISAAVPGMSALDTRSLPVSAAIHRIHEATRANEALRHPLSPGEEAAMIHAAARKLEELFDVLQIDHGNDPHTRDTPRRVAKMFVGELMRGRFAAPPAVTSFQDVATGGQLIISGPIDLRSMCAHHLMPIYGQAFIGVLPGPDGSVVGLSKYDRIVAHFSARLQVQEELVEQIGRFVMTETAPHGLAVRISAVHMCKTHRGVLGSHDSRMVTSAFFGALAHDPALKAQFTQECLALTRPR